MTIEQLQKQADKIEGIREGYLSCLSWVATQLEQEKREKEAAEAKANDTVVKA